jgi:hypothetical protein
MSDEPTDTPISAETAAALAALDRVLLLAEQRGQVAEEMRQIAEEVIERYDRAIQVARKGHELTEQAIQRAEQEQARADAAENDLHKPTGEAIVKAYYKAKRRNKRLTLRKYLQDQGIPEREGYIRKVKVAYDRRKRKG